MDPKPQDEEEDVKESPLDSDDAGRLAQAPGANFYRRIGEKFGRLAR